MKTTPRFPRLRALVRALTSPRRVWFWTTTLPVLLAPVLLYLVMRPGVVFHRSVKVGAVGFRVSRWDDEEIGRFAEAGINWPGGEGSATCLVRAAGQPVFVPILAPHRFGPLIWRWRPSDKGLFLDARWCTLTVDVSH